MAMARGVVKWARLLGPRWRPIGANAHNGNASSTVSYTLPGEEWHKSQDSLTNSAAGLTVRFFNYRIRFSRHATRIPQVRMAAPSLHQDATRQLPPHGSDPNAL